jgi:hypothetical protein
MIRRPVPRQGTKDRIKFELLTRPNGVEGAYRTLMTFIDGVNLYGWPYVEAAEPYVH